MASSRKTISPSIRNRGERAVRAVLPASAEVVAGSGDRATDLYVNGQPVEVQWIGDGNLAEVRFALELQPGRNVIMAGRQMSPGARATLSKIGVSWVDETGAAEIAIGTILVARTGVAPKTTQALKRWTPAVLAVTEALLCGIRGTQAAMEETTELSGGSCANALRFLQDLKLITSNAKRGPKSERRVSDLRGLLTAYSAAVNAQPARVMVQIGVTWQDILAGLADLGHRLDNHGASWALTGGAGAAAIAPFMSSISQATVYVKKTTTAELLALAEGLKLRPVHGGRLTLKPFPSSATDLLATVESDDLRIAPWPRVYADLQQEGVRGEDAAEHLYEVIHEQRSS